ncbi:MAG: hypothetical protein KH347_05530 [Acetobacter sp.]|nr:hypothetical protein [Acetobacter sp.]
MNGDSKATPGGLRACRRVGQADRSTLRVCASSPAATEPSISLFQK